MVFPVTFRTIFFISVIFCVGMVILMWRNFKEKNDYQYMTGKITYLDKKLGTLPFRDLGAYRYLVVENYPYPFEIYADEQGATIDSLKKGDVVTAYFYQTKSTQNEGINRFLQYLEKGNKLYFKRGNTIVIIGVIIIITMLLLSGWSYFLFKKGKIPY